MEPIEIPDSKQLSLKSTNVSNWLQPATQSWRCKWSAWECWAGCWCPERRSKAFPSWTSCTARSARTRTGRPESMISQPRSETSIINNILTKDIARKLKIWLEIYYLESRGCKKNLEKALLKAKVDQPRIFIYVLISAIKKYLNNGHNQTFNEINKIMFELTASFLSLFTSSVRFCVFLRT